MDPLSALSVASAASGFISLGIQTCEGILKYYGSFKNARTDVKRMYSSMERLRATLEQVSRVLTSATTPIIAEIGDEVQRNVQGLELGLITLEKELDRIRITREAGSGVWGTVEAAARRSLYPFRESTLTKLREIVEESLTQLFFILNILQLHTELGLSQSVVAIISSLAETHLDNNNEAIKRWLNPSDPSPSHNSARELRHQQSGEWLLNSWDYTRWKSESGSRLWLCGKAGCGKTIISSTIIEDALMSFRPKINHAVAFFYFRYDFKAEDTRITQYSHMLRSLIVQLSRQSQVPPHKLDELYEQHLDGNRQPSNADLASLYIELIPIFERVLVVLDALDECDDIESLLRFLTDILGKAKGCLGFLVTSRRESKIEESLDEYRQIRLEERVIERDIRLFIAYHLAGPDFQQFPPSLKLEIETDLTRKADGMFQWVACQITTLRKCKNASISQIRSVMVSLPRTLDATYERILSAIDEENRRQIAGVLEFLAFSGGATPDQLSEVVCFNLDDPNNVKFERDRRPLSPRWILEVCSALIQVKHYEWPYVSQGEVMSTADRETVTLSHFSVKEFLTSDRLRNNSNLSDFYLDAKTAHKRIGLCCELYASLFKDAMEELEAEYNKVTGGWLSIYPFEPEHSSLPLYPYAKRSATEHLRKAESLALVIRPRLPQMRG